MYQSVSKRRKALIKAKAILKQLLLPYKPECAEAFKEVRFKGHPDDEELLIKLLAAGTEILLSHQDQNGLDEIERILACMSKGLIPK